MAEDEKRTQQGLLDKAGAEAARLSRGLAETEASLNAAQGRLRHLDANFAELSNERTRLAGALDEANERSEHERANQRTRFEALQARAATEKPLGEAREQMERSVADGALETARKDFARVAREVMALQRSQAALEAPPSRAPPTETEGSEGGIARPRARRLLFRVLFGGILPRVSSERARSQLIYRKERARPRL
jgi:chromosome segregation ATPase